jgi:hypothetical protein
MVVGVIWDISWHMTIGRDTFWTPAHLAIYVGGVSAGSRAGTSCSDDVCRFAGGPCGLGAVLGLQRPVRHLGDDLGRDRDADVRPVRRLVA